MKNIIAIIIIGIILYFYIETNMYTIKNININYYNNLFYSKLNKSKEDIYKSSEKIIGDYIITPIYNTQEKIINTNKSIQSYLEKLSKLSDNTTKLLESISK
ncbi:MAG: hypothetical protein QM532_04540 [Cyanobium sp. MAG06]|nr:hypothetical protein [Cyanobium sp. MAG06]